MADEPCHSFPRDASLLASSPKHVVPGLAHGEAKIFRAKVELLLALVELSAGQFFDVPVLAFAELDPGFAAVNGGSVDLHPLARLLEHAHTFRLQRTVRLDGDIHGVAAIA